MNSLFTLKTEPSQTDSTQSIASIFAIRGGFGQAYGSPTIISRTRLLFSQTLANALSSFFLILVVIWALSVRLLASLPSMLGLGPKTNSEDQYEWDDPKKWKKEKLLKDVRYYASSCGFEIINETAKTKDGYHLRVNRVIDPKRKGEKHSDGRGEFEIAALSFLR